MKVNFKTFFSIALLSLFLYGCGWTDERKDKILGKCIKDKYDCECYLSITMDSYPDPDDYNLKSEEDQEYKDKLELECRKGWKDDQVMGLYDVCDPEIYDCDCGVGAIIENYEDARDFRKAIEEDPEITKELFVTCKLDPK